MKLSTPQIRALKSIRDKGPYGWCEGVGRAGGARSRMCDRLVAAGLLTPIPHEITDAGRKALDEVLGAPPV